MGVEIVTKSLYYYKYFFRMIIFAGIITVQKKYAICRSIIETSIEIAKIEGERIDSIEIYFISALFRLLSINLSFLACNQIRVSDKPAIVRTNAYNVNMT